MLLRGTMSSRLQNSSNPSVHDLLRAAGRGIADLFAQAPGVHIGECKDSHSSGYFVLSGERVVDLNYAFLDGGPDAIKVVDAYVSFLAEVGGEAPLPGLLVIPLPVAQEVRSHLQKSGFIQTPDMSLMVCDLSTQEGTEPSYPNNSPRQVEQVYLTHRVSSAAELEESLRMTSLNFSIPYEPLVRAFRSTLITNSQLAQFLSTLRDEPVTVLQLAGEDRLVGVWSMATLPEYRRQGVGRATLEHALVYARKCGYKLAYLIATPMGLSLYESCSFRTAVKLGVWVSQEST